jgi:hypothetical protein
MTGPNNQRLPNKRRTGVLTRFRVRERRDGRQQARHRRPAHHRPVREERIDPDRPLAHMHQPLRDPYHEQAVRLLIVIPRQLP